MNFEPASEGFLDFFKKKSKQPSRVEKSNILNKMTPGKSINYEEISQKLADMYPDDAKKEFDNRRKYLKTILNAITEVSKKYKNIPGIEFDSAINMIKCFILGMIFLLVVEPILDAIVETIQTVFEALKAKISVYILHKNVEISKLNTEIQGYEENDICSVIKTLENEGFTVVDDNEDKDSWKTYHVLREV